MEISEAEEQLSTEDILEMLDAGAVQLAVADRHIQTIWSKMLSNIRIYPDLAIHQGGQIAWAVRQDNPQLLASLNQFVDKNRKGSLLGNILSPDIMKTAGSPILTPKDDRKRLRSCGGCSKPMGRPMASTGLNLLLRPIRSHGWINQRAMPEHL